MIGQLSTQEGLKRIVNYPRFTIITGIQGSGKKTLARLIGKQLNAHIIIAGTKVDEIREIINLSYKQTEPTVYILPDTDKMSIAAKNALLKVTEEPPTKSYFIMTLIDINNTLETLKSRGTVIPMEAYSPEDITSYWEMKGYGERSTKEEMEVVTNICHVPGDCDTMSQYDINEFNDYINKVIDNIGVVNGANAFKIPDSFKYKEEDEGYDLNLFMRGLMYNYMERMKKDVDGRYFDSIRVVSKYYNQLNIGSVNKKSTMDMWILEMRGIWA